MAAPRSNVASWVTSGRSVAKGAIDAFATARAASPDYTDISKEALQGRARQKKSAMEAESKAKQAESEAATTVELANIKVKKEAAVRDAKKKAAIGQNIAQGGSLIGMGLMKDPDPIQPIKQDFSSQTEYFEKRKADLETDAAKIAEGRATLNAELSAFETAGDQQTSDTLTAEPKLKSRMAGGVSAAGMMSTPNKSQSGTAQFNAAVNRSKPVESNLGDVSKLVGGMGFSAAEWGTFKGEIAKIESGGKYNIFGGSGDHYDGRYQLGAAAKTDGARYAGIADPGHSPGAREAFRNNPQMQERLFEGFTKANHSYLMGNPTYANAGKKRQLEILGYAHNQGMGGAEKWMTTGNVGYDGFGTAGTKYTNAIADAFRNQI